MTYFIEICKWFYVDKLEEKSTWRFLKIYIILCRELRGLMVASSVTDPVVPCSSPLTMSSINVSIEIKTNHFVPGEYI